VNARAPERIVKRAFARGGARSSGFFLRVNAAALQRCAVSPQKAQGERETHGERYSLLSRSRFYACRATLIRGNSPSSSRSSALHARSVRTEWERWPLREQFERCRGVSLSLIRLSLSLSLSLEELLSELRERTKQHPKKVVQNEHLVGGSPPSRLDGSSGIQFPSFIKRVVEASLDHACCTER